MARWIDVSIRLRHGLVSWPGDAPFELNRISDLARGDVCTFSTLSMSAHAGTHVDAPLHFVKGGRSVDTLPLAATVGPARVIAIRNPRVITTDEIRSHRIRAGERLLFKTRNSTRGQPGAFFERYVAMIAPPGRHLAQTHRVLLRAGIWIIEWLDLKRVPAGRCHLVCLPLRIVDGDGAPARAILRLSKTRRGIQTRRA